MALPLPTIEVPSQPSPRAGLLTAAVGPLDMPDVHMETAGAQWEAEACTDGRLYPTACRDVAYDTFVYDAKEALRTVYAFNVYASEVCTPVGTTLREAHARVNRRLALGEQTAVERGLWGGNGVNVTGVFEQMQAAGLVTPVAGTPGPVEALSLLEQTAAGLYDGPIFIHARPRMAAWFGRRGLYDNGPLPPTVTGSLREHKRSWFGSTFVFGSGYSGEKPDGTDPTSTVETIYATGRVFVWRSEVRSPAAGIDVLLNRTTNQRAIFAVRTFAISVECFAAAVTVTRAQDDSTAATPPT